ncbi:Signal transduction histidine kinase [Robiginitalea myxolifaciens]|uniref:histidine kinase n=1 Tax=Robiginitalea myxolifaciens TaxID=400055 RepID=A0A1I6GTC3_9FLAO|nr:ATP-binding protein [Robiginitalea myxolifaciens]SFR45349.1 Signal transduction histidine kinase [Robiginitalea myxolifaciens]
MNLGIRTILSLTISFVVFSSCEEQTTTAEGSINLQGEVVLKRIDSVLESSPDKPEAIVRLLKSVPKTDTVFIGYYEGLLDHLNPVGDSSIYRRVLSDWEENALDKKDTVARAAAYSAWYTLYRRNNVMDSAYLSANSSYTLSLKSDDPFAIASSLQKRAVAEYYLHDYYTSQNTIITALRYLENLDTEEANKRKIFCYNMLGTTANALKNHQQAIDFRLKALELIEDKSFANRSYYSILNNLGYSAYEMQDYEQAMQYFHGVTDYDSLRILEPALYARSLVNLGLTELANNKKDSIEYRYKQALQIRDSLNAERSMPRSYYFLAEYYWAEQDTAKALEYVHYATEKANELGELDALQDIMILEAQIEPEKAPALMVSLDSLKEQLAINERQIQDKFARVRFNTDAYIAENENLERRQLMYIGILAGVLLLGTSVFIIISQRVRNQKLRFEKKQQETNEEIFNLMLTQNEKIEESKKNEQKRISEDLHDGVLGEMNGIRMVLLGLNEKSDEASQSLRKQAITKLQTVQEEIRTISHQLNDSAYEKFHNFIVSLEELLEEFCTAAGLEYEMHFDKDCDWDNLPGLIKINTYRIVQECIQNTVKHAQASRVTLTLGAFGSYCEIRIKDDGVGFETGKGKRGIGQKNIKSRVKKMNGQWEIHSTPGQGTEVILKVPSGITENEVKFAPADR